MILEEHPAIFLSPAARAPRRSQGHALEIAALFPAIRNVSVEILENGVGLSLHRPARRLMFNGSSHLSCTNPYCIGGGVMLLPHLQKMVDHRQVWQEIGLVCGGSEFFHNVPLGPLCPNTFLVTISLEYH